MKRRILAVFATGLLALSIAALLSAAAGEPAPLEPSDLLRDAERAPPALAQILRKLATPVDTLTLTDGERVDVQPINAYLRPNEGKTKRELRVAGAAGKTVAIAGVDVRAIRFYEQDVADGVAGLLKSENPIQGAWAAEKAIRAGLRFSLSHRSTAAPGASPWSAGQDRLSDHLLDVRRRLLKLLSAGEDRTEALRWADVWLPLYPPESALGDDVRDLWIREAMLLAKAGTANRARAWLDRIDATFWHSPPADPLRATLRDRAGAMMHEAKDLPDGKATALLQQAQALWPRLPGLRDTLEKRRQAYQVLYVAVRDLPEFLSPNLAWSDSERQAVELIFEGLAAVRHDPVLGPRYQPAFAERLPAGSGVRRPLRLRRDVYWPDGERFTAADVRHTVQLQTLAGQAGTAPWRELMDSPRLEGNPFGLEIAYREGLLDPWAPLLFKVLPQHFRGKPLGQADDPDFARQPVGTGPYQFAGKEGAGDQIYFVLRANPQYVRAGVKAPESIREIRFYAWKSTEPETAQPAPHLVLDVLPTQAAALKKQGYANMRNLSIPRVWYLGLNHRRAAFANLHIRTALAQAVDRQGLLERHFRNELPGTPATSVNGLFPRGSWANSSSVLVPEELYRPEEARSSARRAGKALANQAWTLKYPAGDPRLDAAFKELATQVGKVLAGADVHPVIRPTPLPPRALQEAVRARDYDLIYLPIDLPTNPVAVHALFDARAEALGPGGSNFLGYTHDARLQDLLRSAVHHRYFPDVKRALAGVHQQLYVNMPLIPLWQLPYPVAVHARLRVPDLDPLAIFGNILEWKLAP